jgi:hypothetical protein
MEVIYSQIEKIREEKRNHRLVIFVGAGVSKNSGACSWWELVKEIADKINYSKCSGCEMKVVNCSSCGNQVNACKDDCPLKYSFTNEEFLLIPQLYFDSQDKNHEEYYSYIKEKFSTVGDPNIIDDIIISLESECIITTNYDHLIEDVNNPNVSKYTVIKKDNELLYKTGNRYIIKMHGDIDDVENIVLREDDYLNYSQNHTLLETYIKSLLIDKTFLFVGYSLNDNNLKLIMSYIDYFVKKNNVIERTPHYLVVSGISNKVKNRKYWKNKGVDLVDLDKITEEMISNVDCESLENHTAKRLYTFLNYINNGKLEYSSDRTKQLTTILERVSQTLNNFHFIGYKTLLGFCKFEHLDMLKTPELVFHDESEYNLFKTITQNKKIRQLFIKARIYGAELVGFKTRESYTFPETIEIDASEELFELSIQSRYKEIMDRLQDKSPSNEKAYYYWLIKYTSELKSELEEVEKRLNRRSKLTSNFCYEWAIFEFNRLSYKNLSFEKNRDFNRFNSFVENAAIMYGEAYTTIKDIADKQSDIQEMNNLLLKHEESYMKKETISKIGGTIYAELPMIQQIMYDYYLFYKKNFLMLDWFNNVQKMATPYVKAILCTYYPDRYQCKNNGVFGRTEVKPYPISLLDIDIIVKHVKSKDFKEWIKKYKVEKLIIDDKIDISVIFENFCKSMRNYGNLYWNDQFETFCYLLSIVDVDSYQVDLIINSILDLVAPGEDGNIQLLINSIPAIYQVVDTHFTKQSVGFYNLLVKLIDVRIIHGVTPNRALYPNMIKRLAPVADSKIYKKCEVEIESNPSDRYNLVYFYGPILLTNNKEKWTLFLKNNISHLPMNAVFQFVIEGTLVYDSLVKRYYSDKVSALFEDYKKQQAVQTFPDYKTDAINDIVILLISGRIKNIKDIDFLKEYMDYSDYVWFIFEPDKFDYSKVDTADVMWCNFFTIDEYRNILLKHKSDYWNEDKERRIELGFGSSFEHRVVYKYLFE